MGLQELMDGGDLRSRLQITNRTGERMFAWWVDAWHCLLGHCLLQSSLGSTQAWQELAHDDMKLGGAYRSARRLSIPCTDARGCGRVLKVLWTLRERLPCIQICMPRQVLSAECNHLLSLHLAHCNKHNSAFQEAAGTIEAELWHWM